LGFLMFFCLHQISFFFLGLHHQFNLVWGSVLTSSGSNPLLIPVAEDRTVILPTKFTIKLAFIFVYLCRIA
jgi:hypothetical protein